MRLNKLPRVRKEDFCVNGVTGSHFVTSERQQDAERFGPQGIAINRLYRPEDAVQDELIDLLCSLLTDALSEGQDRTDSALVLALSMKQPAAPTCFTAQNE